MTEQAPVEVVEAPAAPTETEAPAQEAPPPEAPKEELVSGKLGTLLRREQQFQQKTRAEKEKIASERAEIARERQELDAVKARYARVKDDPIEGLKEAGLSYEDLTKRILNADTPEAKIEAMQAKLEAFEKARETERQELQQRHTTQQIDHSKNEIKSHIFGNPDKYPTLTMYDEATIRERAWDVATQYYAKTQQAPDLDELAGYLEEQASNELKAFDERRAKHSAARMPAIPAQSSSKGKVTKTLTAAKTGERATLALPPDYAKMSPDEQRAHDAEFLAKNLWKD